MSRLFCTAIATTIAFGAPDLARGQSAETTHVAEIVTFRVADGISDWDFIAAAKTTEAFVQAAPGFISRTLSQDEDGLWTDYVIWASMDDAKAAAEAIMKDDTVLPFLNAIKPNSVAMRHAEILIQME
ncbi:antibiotic biosynthesis monooxygenase family protein [Litoreibacter roseus]|uniref:Antibiotic biosynthesis monooxygenase n=1 Tax=Litoreibacter roseus TaxID=2601869 RepID=A0A6N6JIB7_9RHOB|nr:hypothetical protein [Litoreibacter roseus]GFE65854.1 hypothetical protein KIN_29280 [Litoreibacter roseus]